MHLVVNSVTGVPAQTLDYDGWGKVLSYCAGLSTVRVRRGSYMPAKGYDDSSVFQIAHHYFAAIALKGTEKALDWALKAAQHACRLLAYEVAVEHYEHALQMLELAGSREQQVCEIMLHLADTQRLAGQATPSITTLAKVEAIARQRRDGESLARALLGHVNVLRDNSALQESLAHRLEEALEGLPDEDSTLRARVLAAIPIAGFLQTSMAGRLGPYYDKAVAMARRLREPATLATVLHTAHWRMMSDGTAPETALLAATEMIAVARQASHGEKVLDGHLWRSHHLLTLGRVKEFKAEISEHARLAKRLRQPQHLWYAELASSAQARMAGRWREADALATQALGTGLPLLGPFAQAAFAAQMLNSGLEKDGESRDQVMQTVAQTLRNVLGQLPQLPILRAALALAQLNLEPAVSRTAFRRLVEEDLDGAPPDQTFLPLLVILSRLASALEDSARAGIVYGHLVSRSGRHVVIVEVADYWGPVSQHLGVLARTMGQVDVAKAHFERSVIESSAVGAPICRAWAEYELGALLWAAHRTGDAQRGAASLQSALAAAQTIGLARLQKRAREVLRQSV